MRTSRLLSYATNLVSADVVALFVAMHLLSQGHDKEHQAETQMIMYDALKDALSACERHGQLTTNQLAATVLVATYEMAQGRYPAAYFTVGSCARICYVMGLHDSRFATQLDEGVDTWTEKEERRRLWWATVVMDRYINCGFMLRPLAVPQLASHQVLPASDEEWDQGEMAVNPLLVMSIEARSHVWPFARTCQAAHLLGRVVQHIGEHPSIPDHDFHYEEALQIQRAASAFLAMLQQEYSETPAEKRHQLFGAVALCCSALHSLYDVHACMDTGVIESGGRNKGIRMEVQALAIEGYKRMSNTILDLADVSCPNHQTEQHLSWYACRESTLLTAIQEIAIAVSTHGLDRINPFVFNALYAAAATYAWYTRENGSEVHLASLNRLREVLHKLEPRWKVAGKLLRESMSLPHTLTLCKAITLTCLRTRKTITREPV
jgi:hypothetical protein